jgi:hypothetical protein
MNFGRVPKLTKRAWIHKIQPIHRENRPETQMNAVRFLDSNSGPRTVKLRDTPQLRLKRSWPQLNWQPVF